MWIALVIVAVVGVVSGVSVGIAIGRRRAPDASAPLVTPGPQEPGADVNPVLREAVEELEIGVAVADRDGRIVFRNAASTAWSGTHIQPLVDGHIGDALDSARQGRRYEHTVTLHGPPRTHLHLVADPMQGGAAVAVLSDVSAQMRTDAMRTDFVANISHELKTPVGAIAVLAEALAGETDPMIVARLSDRLIDEAHRAVRAIDDLLELAQIEAGDVGADLVDLHSVVNEAITRAEQLAARSDVEVTAINGGASVYVRGDRRQLVSAAGNLVENAVKYSNAHGTVQIRTRVSHRWVELMVADQGVGISERDLDRVFERFYRVDPARSRTTGGTGLGLSIVRHVATNHGGDVQVSSQIGEGSTFVLRLPLSSVVDSSEATDLRHGEQMGADGG